MTPLTGLDVDKAVMIKPKKKDMPDALVMVSVRHWMASI